MIEHACDLEARVRSLTSQVKELEERTGLFQREATAGARMIAELESTLKLQAEARRKLEDLVERQSAELERWRREVQLQKSRADAAEAEKAAAMKCAEEIRREGIEALEQARSAQKAR